MCESRAGVFFVISYLVMCISAFMTISCYDDVCHFITHIMSIAGFTGVLTVGFYLGFIEDN